MHNVYKIKLNYQKMYNNMKLSMNININIQIIHTINTYNIMKTFNYF